MLFTKCFPAEAEIDPKSVEYALLAVSKINERLESIEPKSRQHLGKDCATFLRLHGSREELAVLR